MATQYINKYPNDDLGYFYSKLGKNRKAIDRKKQALEIYYEKVDSLNIASIAHDIGFYYSKLVDEDILWDENSGYAANYYEIAYNYDYWDGFNKKYPTLFWKGIIDF